MISKFMLSSVLLTSAFIGLGQINIVCKQKEGKPNFFLSNPNCSHNFRVNPELIEVFRRCKFKKSVLAYQQQMGWIIQLLKSY